MCRDVCRNVYRDMCRDVCRDVCRAVCRDVSRDDRKRLEDAADVQDCMRSKVNSPSCFIK